jgi:PAS domain S-box-containing protein
MSSRISSHARGDPGRYRARAGGRTMFSSPITRHAAVYPRTEAPARRWPLNALVIAAVLLIGAALTALAWREAVHDQRSMIDRALIARATQIETILTDRLMAYEALMLAGVGLFDASEEVNEEEWRAFALRLRAATLYPGLQGYGYARRIVAGHESGGSASRDRTAIIYLEPLTDRNRAALGFDMMSEEVRRRAMERARDNGVAALTGRVTLVQEITARKQPGFLMYQPVYQHGVPLDTVAERREALLGYVYGPFRTEDFLTAVLGDLMLDVHLEVLDAPRARRPVPIFTSQTRAASNGREYERSRTLDLMGHSWLLKLQPTEAFLGARGASSDARSVLWLGAAGTMLIAAFVWTLALSRTRLARQLDAEQRASERERHAAEILANSLDAHVSIDAEDRVVDWNRQAETVFGWTADEAHGRKLAELIVPERYREAHLAAIRTFPTRKTHPLVGKRIEMPAVRRDGEEITVELSILASAPAGRALYSASVRDVTEIKRHEAEILALNATLEQRVAQRTQELAQANQQLEAFAQNVSHDLRAPLRAIDGFVRLAAEESEPSGSPAKRHLGAAGRQIRKMQHMIDDLLKLAFIGRQPMERREVDLREMVLAITPDLNVHRPPAAVSVADDLGVVNADPALLEHALRNLLSNAFKFSRGASEPRIEIGVMQQDGERVYYVRDNGVGFEPERTGRLFRAFTRLHSASEFEGSGVGLTIVQSVIERHGGRIWADAEPGAGATFYFTIGMTA